MYIVRQITSVEFEYLHHREGKDFDKSVNYFIQKISKAICEIESLKYNEVKEYVKKGLPENEHTKIWCTKQQITLKKLKE